MNERLPNDRIALTVMLLARDVAYIRKSMPYIVGFVFVAVAYENPWGAVKGVLWILGLTLAIGLTAWAVVAISSKTKPRSPSNEAKPYVPSTEVRPQPPAPSFSMPDKSVQVNGHIPLPRTQFREGLTRAQWRNRK